MGKTKKLKSVLEKSPFQPLTQKKTFDGYQPGEPGFDRKMMV